MVRIIFICFVLFRNILKPVDKIKNANFKQEKKLSGVNENVIFLVKILISFAGWKAGNKERVKAN